MLARIRTWFASLSLLGACSIGIVLAFAIWNMAEDISAKFAIPIIQDGLRSEYRQPRNLYPEIYGVRLFLDAVLTGAIAFMLVLALVHLVFVRRQEPLQSVNSEAATLCPECKSGINQNARRCAECHSWIGGAT